MEGWKLAVSKVPGTFKTPDPPENVLDPGTEEELRLPWPAPMVEVFIHNGGLEIQQVPTPQGNFTLLRLHTPATVYTIKLDEGGTENLLKALGGVGANRILIAGAHEVPNLKG